MATSEARDASKGGRPRSIQAQQAILDATLALLASEGFDAMSVEAIAARAGVGKKTIYRWWNSKEALVIDAIKQVQQASVPVIETGSLRDDLIALFSSIFQAWARPDARDLLLELIRVTTTHPEVFQIYDERILAPRLQLVTQMIQRAQERGMVRQDLDVSEILSLIAGPVWYYLLFQTQSIPPALPAVERLVDALLYGIAGQKQPEDGATFTMAQNTQDNEQLLQQTPTTDPECEAEEITERYIQ